MQQDVAAERHVLRAPKSEEKKQELRYCVELNSSSQQVMRDGLPLAACRLRLPRAVAMQYAVTGFKEPIRLESYVSQLSAI